MNLEPWRERLREDVKKTDAEVLEAHHRWEERAKKMLAMSDDELRKEMHDLFHLEAGKTVQGMNGTVKTIAFWLVIGLSALLLGK